MDYKQVILVRTNLKMGRGKACAQVAHASLGSAEVANKVAPKWHKAWKAEGQKKVVLRASGEDEILHFYNHAKKVGLPCYLVKDAGLTELPPGTMTTLGIGPAPNELVDKVTGELKLLS
ncbi:MAG: peptidyl-tRNA hydrolase Pth2 [Candidatus Hydrothermarchaeota archaeon]|jgi:PTH2 family peptidyl-tRNA hydrolase|nr:peptidyl-tRNA hydrolase Pth2 [Candidatus Hydrothermarchaeota archaeon]MDP6613262.1 peptidyl-tRNA hydrolase Pth2 [Candidatus Hydrothermarchaeota archaeon]